MTLTLRKLVLPFCLLGLMWTGTAHAAPPNDPVSNLFVTGGFNGSTNGQVNAAVLAGTPPILYIGGDFSAVRPYSGHGVVLDADPTHIGTADAAFPQVDGDVFDVVPDGAGGWYIAGAFTGVGGVPQRNVAHIKANKTVDTAWRPDPTGLIRTLALSNDGKTLYIGGDFEGFGPTKQPPLRLAAIGADLSKPAEYGQPTSWAPDAKDSVRALAISDDDSLLYVGGDFFDQVINPGDTPKISIGGQIRNHLAAVLTTGPNAGKATTWNPNVDGRVQTLGLAKNGNVLYVGGNFHNVGTPPQLRNNLAAVLTSGTGTLKAWNPDVNKQVLTLTVQGKRIYIGGKFTQVGVAARNFVAALDKQTGLADPLWDANPGSSVQAIVVAGSTVYLGGNFASVNGPIQSGVLRNNIAAVRKSDGVALLSWNPNFNGPAGKDDGTVLALALNPLDSTQLYAGGTFDSAGEAVARNNLAAFDATTGALRADIDPHPDGPVYALAAFGNTVYAGGDFPSFQGGAVVLQRLASINAATGQLVSTWHPDADGAVRALAVSPDGNIVYAGGEFSIIASVARARLGAISAASGGPWPPPPGLPFDPGVDGPVLALATLGTDKLYVGGTFSNIASTGRTNLALIKSAGGTNPGLIQSWDPQPNGAVHTILLGGTTACTPAAAPTVYIGGAFTTLNSGVLQRNHLAALKTTGTPVQVCNWNPGADGAVRALALSGDTLFIGGDFTAAGTVSPRCRLAAVDLATGIAKSVIPTLGGWNPGVNTTLNKAINPPPVVCPVNSNSVRTLAESDSVGKLYVGGLFSRIQGSTSTQLDPPGLPRNNLAAFSFATLDSVISPLTSTTHTGTLVNGILVTVTNQAPITAQQVSLAPKTLIPGNPAFNFISWDPTTGFGTYNTPVNIPPFPGQQIFFIAFDPLPVIDPPVEVQFTVEGTNTTAAGSVTGVNTLFLGATDPSIPTANIPALAQDSNGVPVAAVQFPTTTTTCTGQTSFIVAARNTGETEAILVTPKGTGGVDDSDPGGNVKLTICLLDGNGQCVDNPPAGANIPLTFTGGNTSAAFKVTVAGAKNASIPNDPNNNRIKVEFRNSAQKPALRGLASVAVSTFGSCQ